MSRATSIAGVRPLCWLARARAARAAPTRPHRKRPSDLFWYDPVTCCGKLNYPHQGRSCTTCDRVCVCEFKTGPHSTAARVCVHSACRRRYPETCVLWVGDHLHVCEDLCESVLRWLRAACSALLTASGHTLRCVR